MVCALDRRMKKIVEANKENEELKKEKTEIEKEQEEKKKNNMEKRTQVKWDPAPSVVEIEKMDVVKEEEGEENERKITRKLNKIIQRISKLERGLPLPNKDSTSREDSSHQESPGTEWTTVVKRNRGNKPGKEEEKRRKEEEERKREEEKRKQEGRRKEDGRTEERKRKNSLRTIKRKIPKGAGVLIEITNGTREDYEEVFKACEKEISLEELDIPPLGMRKARGGGVIMEVVGDHPERKAETLAGRIKEVIGTREEARIFCPTKCLRLRLFGLAAPSILKK